MPSGCVLVVLASASVQADHFLTENNVKLALVLWSGPAGLWLAAALRPRGHNKCAALWAAAAAEGAAGAEAARMMSRRSRGRTHHADVLNYSNPGKESWSGHGAFRGARRRRRGSRLRRHLTRREAACKYWRTLGRRKMDQCGNLRALWGGLIDVLVGGQSGLWWSNASCLREAV